MRISGPQVAETSTFVPDDTKQQCLNQSKDQLKNDMRMLIGHHPAMKQTHYSTVPEKIEICVWISEAALYETRKAEIDVLKGAGLRPAMRRTPWLAMVEKMKMCVC